MGRPLGFAPEAALEDLALPLWGPGVEVVQLIGLQGFWQHQALRGVGGSGSRRYSALEGYGNQYWPVCSSALAWRTPLPDREAWQATVYRVAKSQTLPMRSCAHRHKTFCLWQLCPSQSWAWRWGSCLACRDPGGANFAGTRTVSAAGVMALSVFFFWASCSWRSEDLFGQSLRSSAHSGT